MPHMLNELKIHEVSLVDNPANSSICPKTGRKIRHSIVALYKRDSSDDPPPTKVVNQYQSKTKENKMEFESIMKSSTATRAEIVSAVVQKAEAIAKKEGVGREAAEAFIWKNYPEASAAYERATLPTTVRQERRVVAVTKSEVLLDSLARKLQKSDPTLSLPQAYSAVLDTSPALYQQYEKEAALQQWFVASEDNISKGQAVGFEGDEGEDPPTGETCISCGGKGRTKNGKGQDAECPVCSGTGVEPFDDQGDGDEDKNAEEAKLIASLQKLDQRVAKLESKLAAAR